MGKYADKCEHAVWAEIEFQLISFSWERIFGRKFGTKSLENIIHCALYCESWLESNKLGTLLPKIGSRPKYIEFEALNFGK